MITPCTDEADKVAGLEAWVDDYVTKPFSPRELKARIKAVLRRRAPEAAQEPLVAGALRVDPATHRVTADGTRFRLASPSSGCRVPARRPVRVDARAQLWTRCGATKCIEERTVDVHIRRLRVALEPFGQETLVETVRGSGYRLAAPRDTRCP